mmetsp:Transcript_37819/g.111966  ORF Transcript_37819/g.111966 Transcript_37819/m.111966 type:complete len:226 (+) Transcript_37819:740-1417(+)
MRVVMPGVLSSVHAAILCVRTGMRFATPQARPRRRRRARRGGSAGRWERRSRCIWHVVAAAQVWSPGRRRLLDHRSAKPVFWERHTPARHCRSFCRDRRGRSRRSSRHPAGVTQQHHTRIRARGHALSASARAAGTVAHHCRPPFSPRQLRSPHVPQRALVTTAGACAAARVEGLPLQEHQCRRMYADCTAQLSASLAVYTSVGRRRWCSHFRVGRCPCRRRCWR